jgi:ankyrin repeat protein
MSNNPDMVENNRAIAGLAVTQLCQEWEAAAKPQQKPPAPPRHTKPELYDKTNLFHVCDLGDFPAFLDLVAQGVDIHKDSDLPLKWAARGGSLEIINFMLEHESDIHSWNGGSILQWPAFDGNIEVIRFLLDKNADIHADNDVALRMAAKKGHLEIVRFLLDKGADIHADEDIALRIACAEGRLETVGFLFEKGADIHVANGCPLRWAAQKGHVETVRFLLDKGADIHAKEDAALLVAAEKEQFEMVRLLLERGAPLEKLSDEQRQAYEDYKRSVSEKSAHANKTLTEAFKTATWVGHVPEMVELWNGIPEILQTEFDFQSALSAVNRENLKQSTAKKPKITLIK